MPFSTDKESCRKALEKAGAGKVALRRAGACCDFYGEESLTLAARNNQMIRDYRIANIDHITMILVCIQQDDAKLKDRVIFFARRHPDEWSLQL